LIDAGYFDHVCNQRLAIEKELQSVKEIYPLDKGVLSEHAQLDNLPQTRVKSEGPSFDF